MKVEALMKNVSKFNKKTFEECALAGSRTSLSIIMIVSSCLLIDIAYQSCTIKAYGLVICSILVSLIGFIMPFYIYRRNGSKNYKNHMLLTDGNPNTLDIAIYENHLTYHTIVPPSSDDKISTQSTVEATLTHDKLSKVYSFKENYIMVYANQTNIPIQKTSFTKGSSEEFEDFLVKKGIKLKRKLF